MAQHRLTQLDNGLTVATERVPDARSVAIGCWVRVGARDEPDRLAGVSHFVEHVVFKGTEHRSAREVASMVERVGGDLNAFTSKEFTSFYCRLPASRAELGFEVLTDLLVRPALRDADIESERQVILEELAIDDDSPEDVVHRHLAELVFARHPLGRDTAGSADTVGAITADDLRQWFTERYRPDAMVVAVAGACDHDEVVAAADRAFGALPAGATPLDRRPPEPMAAADDAVVTDTEQAHLAVGLRALSRTHPDREALDVVVHVLGGGPASRLFDEVREQRGLAYSVYASNAAFDDTGALTVYAGTSPGQLGTVRGLVLDQLDSMRTDGVTADELEVASGYLCGAFELGLEDVGARMSRLGGQLITRRSVRPVDEQLRRWASVTRADVARVADDLLGGPRAMAVVVPPDA